MSNGASTPCDWNYEINSMMHSMHAPFKVWPVPKSWDIFWDILRFCSTIRISDISLFRGKWVDSYIMTLFQDICRIFGAKTSDIFSHDKSLIIGYSRILNPGYWHGLYSEMLVGKLSARGFHIRSPIVSGEVRQSFSFYSPQKVGSQKVFCTPKRPKFVFFLWI